LPGHGFQDLPYQSLCPFQVLSLSWGFALLLSAMLMIQLE
jgi:hypothetical protein